MTLEAVRLLKKLGLVPRRTIRAVLFTNEENGARGGRDYAKRFADAMDRHVAAIEIDSGGARPTGFGVTAGPGGIELVRRFAAPLALYAILGGVIFRNRRAEAARPEGPGGEERP